MEKIKIACLGDSLTNGRVSYNWIKELRKEMKDVYFYNFGKDGDLAFNGLERITEVTSVDPDYIFVLLWTNDVNASMNSPEAMAYYTKNKHLPRNPTLTWYLECMEEILQKLREKTHARIIVMSIPILGEDLSHEANKKVEKYNAELRKICEWNNVTYLDFHRKLVEYLENHTLNNPVALLEEFSMMKKALFRRFVLFQDWNTISHKHWLLLTTDTIHLNMTSGKMLAECVKNEIEQDYPLKT